MRKMNSIVLKKQWIILFVIMMFVFQPISFNRIQILKFIFNLGRVGSFMYVTTLFIKNQGVFSKLFYYECILWIFWFFPTLFYDGNTIDDYIQFVTKFMICSTGFLCFERMLCKDSKLTVTICDYLFSIYAYINLVLAIYKPLLFGNDSTYFLGAKNAAASILILFMLFKSLNSVLRKNSVGWKPFVLVL